MKYLILAALLLGLTACGEDTSKNKLTCASLDFTGEWENFYQSGDFLTVNNNCTISTSYCEHEMSFTLPNENSSNTILTIHSANLGDGCEQPGKYSCKIGMLENGLFGIECDSVPLHSYKRNFQ